MKAAAQTAIDFAYGIVEWICRIILLFMAVVVAAQVFVRAMLIYLADLVLLFMNICMAYYGVQLAMHASKATLPITGLPQSSVYLMTIVSGILSSIVLVAKLFGMYQTEDTKAFLEQSEVSEEGENA